MLYMVKGQERTIGMLTAIMIVATTRDYRPELDPIFIETMLDLGNSFILSSSSINISCSRIFCADHTKCLLIIPLRVREILVVD